MKNDLLIPLFHATTKHFDIEKIVIADRNIYHYPEVTGLLEFNRPLNSPSRLKCLFAADTSLAATTFLYRQGVDIENIHIYQVEMNCYHKAPFRLIHELSERIKIADNVDQLIDEYWHPRLDWYFWEYFGSSFKIIEKTATAKIMDIYSFNISYEKDCILSTKL